MTIVDRARGSYPPQAGRPFTPEEDAIDFIEMGTGPASRSVIAEVGGPSLAFELADLLREGVDAIGSDPAR